MSGSTSGVAPILSPNLAYSYGYWTGASLFAGTTIPTFVPFTSGSGIGGVKFPIYDMFDGVSRTHDLAYGEAQNNLLNDLNSGVSNAQALESYYTALGNADDAFVTAATATPASTVWGNGVRATGITVLGLRAEEDRALAQYYADPANAALVNAENYDVTDLNALVAQQSNSAKALPVDQYNARLAQIIGPLESRLNPFGSIGEAISKDPSLLFSVVSHGISYVLDSGYAFIGGELDQGIDTVYHLARQIGAGLDTLFQDATQLFDSQPPTPGMPPVTVAKAADGTEVIAGPQDMAATPGALAVTNTGQVLQADDVGSLFGSTIGNLLVRGNGLEGVGVGAALGTAVGLFVSAVKNAGGFEAGLTAAVNSLPSTFVGFGASGLASFGAGELLNVLGVKGPLRDLGTSVAGQVIGKIAYNVITSGSIGSVSSASVLNAVGQWAGTEIGEAVLAPRSQEGQIGGQVGAAYGALSAAPAGPVAVAVEAFAYYIAGTLIGDLIGGVPSPQALNTIGLITNNAGQLRFAVTAESHKDKGPVSTVDDLGQSVVGTLNGILDQVGGRVISSSGFTPFTFGIRRTVPLLRAGNLPADYNFPDVPTLENYAVLGSLKHLVSGGIAGGDIYVKRAIDTYLSTAFDSTFNPYSQPQNNAAGALHGDVQTLVGSVSIALDYERYLQNSQVINALIASDSTSDPTKASPFATGWLATLAQARALGLDKRGLDDWTGGWKQFLSQQGVDAEQVRLGYAGNTRLVQVGGTTIADTVPTDAKDVITSTVAGTTIAVNETGTVQANGNVTFNGAADTGQSSRVGAVITAAPGGNDVVYSGGQGDDVIGSSAAGQSELLIAGSPDGTPSALATWLVAGAGNDTLFGDVSGGAVLQAGSGNDVLVGRGSSFLIGGSGNDTLDGSNAGDVFQVGAGSHTTLINAGSGDDTIVFGFGDGTVVANNAGGANDELSLGAGVGWTNLIFSHPSGTNNLVLQLVNNGTPTGDQITLDNWFVPGNRVNYLRLDDGTKVDLGDVNFYFTQAGTNIVTTGTAFVFGTSDNTTVDGFFSNTLFANGLGKNNWVQGSPGNDVIVGGNGDDTIFGGFGGRDILTTGPGTSILIASPGGDTLHGGPGANTIAGGGGNDVIEFNRGDGMDTILNPLVLGPSTLPGAGVQVANANGWTAGYSYQHFPTGGPGGGGYDVVSNGNDTLFDSRTFGISASGSDGYFEYDRGAKALYHWSTMQAIGESAGSGQSTISFGAGIGENAVRLERSGNDLLIGVRAPKDFTSPFSSSTDLITLPNYFIDGSPVKTLSFVNGTIPLSQVIFSNNVFQGADHAILYADDNNDSLITLADANGGGYDTFIGGPGDDTFGANGGHSIVHAGNGDNLFYSSIDGNDTFIGGTGFNTVSFNYAQGPVVANLAQAGETNAALASGVGAGANNSFTGVSAVVGSANYADTLIGGDRGMDFDGNTGSSNDSLVGGLGPNIYRVHATTGVSILDEGGNDDTLVLQDGQSLLNLSFAQQAQQLAIANGTTAAPTSLSAANAVYTIGNFYAANLSSPGTGVIQTLLTKDGRVAPLGNIVLNGTATGAAPALVVGNVIANGTLAPLHVLRANNAGDLLLGAAGNDTFYGGSGSDTFEGGSGSNDFVGGSSSLNFVSYADGPGAVSVTVNVGPGWDHTTNGFGGQDTLQGIHGIIGSATGNDTIVADGTDDILCGNGNVSATIEAGTLVGGTGQDTLSVVAWQPQGESAVIRADAGNGTPDNSRHVIQGGSGDTTIYGGSSAGDLINVGIGATVVYDGPGNDTVTPADVGGPTAGEDTTYFPTTVHGGSGNDLIQLGAAGGVAYAGAGNTTITGGGNGADTLVGGDGNDVLTSLSDAFGNDVLINGADKSTGNDTLIGGSAPVPTGGTDFVVYTTSGQTVIQAGQGVSDITLVDPTSSVPLALDRVWLAANGNNLVISVIGSTARITLPGFLSQPAGAIPALRRLIVGNQVLFLDRAFTPVPSLGQTVPGAYASALTTLQMAHPGQTLVDAHGVPLSPVVQVDNLLGSIWTGVNGPGFDQLVSGTPGQAITGSQSLNFIQGGGQDILTAGPLQDTLVGAGGFNRIVAGNGGDLITALGGGDTVVGGAGNDTVHTDAGTLVTTAPDNVSFSGSGAHIAYGGPNGGTFSTSYGGADTIIGDGQAPTAHDGADVFNVDGSRQLIVGGNSSNTFNLFLLNRNDIIRGGGLLNKFVFSDASSRSPTGDVIGLSTVPGATNILDFSRNSAVTVDLRGATKFISGAAIVDTPSVWDIVAGSSSSTIYGAAGNNSITGGSGGDYISVAGNTGQDTLDGSRGGRYYAGETLVGGNGGDVLLGGAGADSLIGGTGKDTFVAGLGNEILRGGGGGDLFEFGANDGQDTVDLTGENGATIAFNGANGSGGVNYDHLWFQQQGNDLLISVIGHTGQVRLWNWFNQGQATMSITYFYARQSYTTSVNVPNLVNLDQASSSVPSEQQLQTLLTNTSFSYSLNADWNLDHAPTVVSVPSTVSGAEDQPITFDVQFADQDPGDNLTLTAASSNPGLIDTKDMTGGQTLSGGAEYKPVRDNNNLFLWHITLLGKTYQSGTTTVTFTATDLAGKSVSAQTAVSVAGVNYAPSITAIGDQTVAAGASDPIPFTVNDPETPASSLNVAVSGPSFLTATLGGSGSNRTLTLSPAYQYAQGSDTVTLSVTDQAVNGQPAKTTPVSFTATFLPTYKPLTSGVPSTLSVVEDTTATSASFSVSDAAGVPVTASLSGDSWLGASLNTVSGSPGNYTISLQPATDQAGSGNLDLHLDDGNGGVLDVPVGVTVIPVNHSETIAIESGGAFSVADSTSINTPVGTVDITSRDTNAPAVADGYNTLTFATNGVTYYKNGQPVAAPQGGDPITVSQDSNNRSRAYIKPTFVYSYPAYNEVKGNLVATDGGGLTSNTVPFDITIPNPFPQDFVIDEAPHASDPFQSSQYTEENILFSAHSPYPEVNLYATINYSNEQGGAFEGTFGPDVSQGSISADSDYVVNNFSTVPAVSPNTAYYRAVVNIRDDYGHNHTYTVDNVRSYFNKSGGSGVRSPSMAPREGQSFVVASASGPPRLLTLLYTDAPERTSSTQQNEWIASAANSTISGGGGLESFINDPTVLPIQVQSGTSTNWSHFGKTDQLSAAATTAFLTESTALVPKPASGAMIWAAPAADVHHAYGL